MEATTVGIDLAKEVFHACAMSLSGKVLFKKKLARKELNEFVAQLPEGTLIGMESCSSAQYWRREFEYFGHRVRLMAPQFVKPYVKTNKNDFNDAEAIAEAVMRANMRFVPAKTVAQQDMQSLHRIREGFVRNRTELINRIRGLLREYGVVIGVGALKLRRDLPRVLEESTQKLSPIAQEFIGQLYVELGHIDEQVDHFERMIRRIFKQDPVSQRLEEVQGVGVLTATAIVATVGDISNFKNGRQMAAWLGLVPRQHSSGGKSVLLGISKRGDSYVRTLLIHGARSAIIRSKSEDPQISWARQVKERRGMNKACVALANKNARILWALMSKNESYRKAA